MIWQGTLKWPMNRLTRFFTLFHCIFLVTGMATVLLGVLLAHGSLKNGGDRYSGVLLGTQFCGQLFGSMFLMRRSIRSLAIGLGVVIVSSSAIAWEDRLAQPMLLILGVGLGMVMASVNVAAGQEAGPLRRGRVLELLNVFWPVGAALCAPAETLVSRFTRPSETYALVSTLLTACLLWLALTKRSRSRLLEEKPAVERPVPVGTLTILALVALLVVGVETGISGWLPTLAQRLGSSPRMIAGITAVFWCGTLVARLVAAHLLRRISLHRLSMGAATGTVLFCALLPWSSHPILLLLIAMCAACCIAPLYPALLANCVELKGKQFVFVCAGLGAAVAPWSIGATSTSLGSLRTAMLLPFAGAVLMTLAMGQAGLFSTESQ